MAAHLETWSKEEIRAVVRFLNAKSLNPTEIYKELQSAYGEHVMSRTQVYHCTSDARLAREIWMGHPPHSPDLAPSDCHLFGPLKRELAGKRFDDDEELVDHVRKWLQNLERGFFRESIYSMVRRWQKCVDRLGCYVEK
ncbi:histone-lysine N-methyltransferase SETMAR [Elysia marginata]|uniref:Histone-lysine N-methyltransferase SETMAR n=1 Tax=Elysia marginata TaxID=1093978 RepID=A0AAV4FU75_9GAST|nr:histone-lysine N-methyltransferase SETMAR [Elysia marginata]